MTDRPMEPMDAFETRLSNELVAASGIAIRAINPVETAIQLAADARRAPRRLLPRGFVLILATIGLVVALLAAYVAAGHRPAPIPQVVDRPTLQELSRPSPAPSFGRLPVGPPPRLGHIAYQSGDDIYVAKADGSGPVRVTNTAADGRFYSSPVWAGSLLTFLGDGNGLHKTLFALDRIDGQPRAIGRANPAGSYSPAADRFALLRGASLSIVDADGGVVSVPAPPGFKTWDHSDVMTLSWTPDGAALLVTACASADCTRGPLDDVAVFLVAADGRLLKQLSTPEAPMWGAQVSPDGSRIAFMTCQVKDRHCYDDGLNDGPDLTLGFAAIDGGDRVIAPDPPNARCGYWSPRWSADGTKVFALAALKDGSSQVMVVEATGGVVPKAVGPDGSRPFAWTPDGTAILTVTHGGGAERLALLPIDDSSPFDLATIDRFGYGADLEWIDGSGPDPFDAPAPAPNPAGS